MDMYCDVMPLDKDLNMPSPASIDLVKPFVRGAKLLDRYPPTLDMALLPFSFITLKASAEVSFTDCGILLFIVENALLAFSFHD